MPQAIRIPPLNSLIGGVAAGGVGVTHPPTGNAIQSTASNAVHTITAPFQSWGQFLGRLGNPNTWIRVGEFAIGATLLLVGVAHLTGADSTAMKVAKKAALL